jgi:hypothetical protein
MGAVPLELFRDDDRAYLNWIAANSDGFVLNIERGRVQGALSPGEARVHLAVCWTISRPDQRYTDQWVKLCATDLEELDRWAVGRGWGPIRRCGTCHPPAAPGKAGASPRQTVRPQAGGRMVTG